MIEHKEMTDIVDHYRLQYMSKRRWVFYGKKKYTHEEALAKCESNDWLRMCPIWMSVPVRPE